MGTKENYDQTSNKNTKAINGLSPEFLSLFNEAMHAERVEEVRKLTGRLHHSDLADLLEGMAVERREWLIELLREDLNPNMIAELDGSVLGQLADQIGIQEMAEAVAEMDTDDAVDVVEELAIKDQLEILDALPHDDRLLIEEGLSYPEDSAGRLMQREAVGVPSHWNVGQAIDLLRKERDLPRDFFDIFLVDSTDVPVGSIPLSRIMRAHRHVALNALMVGEMKTVPVEMDQEDVAFLFRQRDLVSAPVVDNSAKLVGVITIDDVVDVIHEENEEDIMRLAGVGEDDDLYDAVISTTRSRFSWLLIHLVAAISAAYVISLFTETIEELVFLAVLMPIVATMGGTASVQALTVVVRAIAMKELAAENAFRTIRKEVAVGLFNGIIFAILIGTVAWGWFGSPALGGVIALAIIINLLAAGLSGSALPVILNHLGFDPAIASSAFLTSITDVLGFYVFLGLATLLLL